MTINEMNNDEIAWNLAKSYRSILGHSGAITLSNSIKAALDAKDAEIYVMSMRAWGAAILNYDRRANPENLTFDQWFKTTQPPEGK